RMRSVVQGPMGNGCGRGRSAGHSLLDWLQRSPPRVALWGFRATGIERPSAADGLRTCETSLGEQSLQAANRAGSRAGGEEDFQFHAAAGAGQVLQSARPFFVPEPNHNRSRREVKLRV